MMAIASNASPRSIFPRRTCVPHQPYIQYHQSPGELPPPDPRPSRAVVLYKFPSLRRRKLYNTTARGGKPVGRESPRVLYICPVRNLLHVAEVVC